jgi:8-oxo-dGTP diphosphatase
MSELSAHGVVEHQHLNRKNDYLFRISMKSLVRDNDGNVLVVKESGRTWWDLPGGGMDHEESIKDAIARELFEEVHLTGNFTYQVIAVEEPSFLEHAQVWQVRMIFAVKPESSSFEPGEDADEVLFINPDDLKGSENIAERKVYEYAQLAVKLLS